MRHPILKISTNICSADVAKTEGQKIVVSGGCLHLGFAYVVNWICLSLSEWLQLHYELENKKVECKYLAFAIGIFGVFSDSSIVYAYVSDHYI